MELRSPVMIPWSCRYCSRDISRARRRSICSSMITSCTGSVKIQQHQRQGCVNLVKTFALLLCIIALQLNPVYMHLLSTSGNHKISSLKNGQCSWILWITLTNEFPSPLILYNFKVENCLACVIKQIAYPQN